MNILLRLRMLLVLQSALVKTSLTLRISIDVNCVPLLVP